MTTWQIWGNFAKDDLDRDFPTTISLIRKDELMLDGFTRKEDFERQFAVDEGEDFVLMREFELNFGDLIVPQEIEWGIVNQVYDAYLDGWWNKIKE